MKQLKVSKQVKETMQRIVFELTESNAEAIDPKRVADYALQELDPDNVDNPIRRWSMLRQFRSIAGRVCADTHDPVIRASAMDDAQLTLFGYTLQTHYPIADGDQTVYKRTDLITFEEWAEPIARMRKAASSLNKHCDAAEAYRQQKATA